LFGVGGGRYTHNEYLRNVMRPLYPYLLFFSVVMQDSLKLDFARKPDLYTSICPANQYLKRHAVHNHDIFEDNDSHKACLHTEGGIMSRNVLLVPKTVFDQRFLAHQISQIPTQNHISLVMPDSCYSALLAASLSTSSTPNLAFFGSLLTLCQISPCFGSANAALASTSAFFSSVPCCSRNL
jgi:hypothetical protein